MSSTRVSSRARSWIAASLLAFGAVFTGPAATQTPAPLAIPNPGFFAAGEVNAIARLADGGFIVGGRFDFINEVPRRNLAKLLADGNLDPNWNPGANAAVFAIAVHGDGFTDEAVFVGGQFSEIGGESKSRIAKVAPGGTGLVDSTWAPPASGTVRAIALDGTGNVIYPNGFGSLVKVTTSGTGTAIAGWSSAVSGGSTPNVLALHRFGTQLYVGGTFSSIGGVTRSRFARLDAVGTGTVDGTWNPAPNQAVNAIDTDAAGTSIFAGGFFTNIGGQPRNQLAKLASTGTGLADATWNPAPNTTEVKALLVEGTSVYAAGTFSTIGGASRIAVAKLSTTGSGTADAGFNAGITGFAIAYALASNGAGEFLVGGLFDNVAAQQRVSLITVAATTGALQLPAQNAELSGIVNAILPQTGGGTIVGGVFVRAGATPRAHITRLLANGTVDAAWTPTISGVGTASVHALVEGPSGEVFIAANDQSGAGQLVKVSGTGAGAAIPGFAAVGSNEEPLALALRDDNLYLGGDFTTAGGMTRNRVARVSAATGVLSTWAVTVTQVNPLPNNKYPVRALAVDTAGNVYIGGRFNQVGASTRHGLAKVSSAGILNASWNPASAGTDVHALVLDGSGALYVGGTLQSIGGAARGGVAKLSTAGVVDSAFNPSLSTSNLVRALALDGSGALFAGGEFTLAGGAPVPRLARISATGAGAVDTGFTPTPNQAVRALAKSGTSLFAGGDFSLSGTAPRGAFAAYALPVTVFTTTTITSDEPEFSAVGTPYTVQFTVTATAGSPAGTVTVSDGANTCGPVVLVSGAGACQLPSTELGIRQLLASFTPANPASFTASAGSASHTIADYDFGDAPASYGTLLANDGARHFPGFAHDRIEVDTEPNGVPQAAALGDDAAGFDDEADAFIPALVRGTTVVLETSFTENVRGNHDSLDAWIDWNRDGDFFDAGEKVIAYSIFSGQFPPPAMWNVNVPANAVPGISYARFRSGPGDLPPTGPAYSGEVEDHQVTIVNANPTASNPGARNTNEDTPSASIPITVADTDSAAATLVLSAQSDNPSIVTDASLVAGLGGSGANRTLVVTPVAQANSASTGTANITLTVTDTDGGSSTQQFAFTVNAVNDAPSLSVVGNIAWPAGTAAGPRTQPGFITAVTLGPGNEFAQTVLEFLVAEANDPANVVSGAAIANDGTLTYTLSGNTGGVTLNARVRDNGGVANGGVDTSTAVAFAITVGGSNADLSISKSNGVMFVSPGQPTSYTIAVNNIGPSNVSSAIVEDTPPPSLTGVTWQCLASGGGSCPAGGNGAINVLVDLPVNGSATFTLTGTVAANAQGVSNTATVTPPIGINDVVTANNTATDADVLILFTDSFESP